MGSIVLSGLTVTPENAREDLSTGTVSVTVSGDKLDATKLDVIQVAEYGVKLSVAEVKTLKAGHGQETVKVTLEETTPGSLGNKTVYVAVDGANIVSVANLAGVTPITDKNGNITEIEINPTAGKYEMEITLSAKASDLGSVIVTAEGRGLETELTAEAATITTNIALDATQFNITPGLKDQKGGELVITEAEAGAWGKGTFVIKNEADVKISAADITVTGGDLNIDTEITTDGALVINVKRTSSEASEITINNITMTAPKYMAEGAYDLYVGGTLVAEANTSAKAFEDKLTMGEFLIVGERQVSGEAVFTVGETSFNLNGEAVAMDVAPYISAKNRVMIPVRFLAQAFGIEDKNILFDQATGTVTMFIGSDIVQLTNGKAVALVNGIQIPMEEQMTIKEDRTFVPMGELARILGVEVEWDNTAKTATFFN